MTEKGKIKIKAEIALLALAMTFLLSFGFFSLSCGKRRHFVG